jgi:hypothetical protein
LQEIWGTNFLVICLLESYLFAWTRVEVINQRLTQVSWSRTIKSREAMPFAYQKFFQYVQHPGKKEFYFRSGKTRMLEQ